MSRRLVLLVTVVAILVPLLLVGVDFFVDWLWYADLGYESVFFTVLASRWLLFLLGALLFFGIFTGNVLLAARLAGRAPRHFAYMVGTARPPERRGVPLGLLLAGIFLALVAGGAASSEWSNVLRYANPVAFGTPDPLFGQDVGFFVYTLPFLSFLQGWLQGALVFALLGVAFIYLVRVILPRLPSGGQMEIDLSQLRIDLSLSGPVRRHLALLGAGVLVLIAIGHWLSTYELVYAAGGLVYGAGYADVHARLPMLWITAGLALLAAVLTAVGGWRRGWLLPVAGVGLWLLGVVATGVYPGLVQRLEVQPSELDKERPYIANNIRMTRQAYALDRIAEVDFPAAETVTAQEVQDNPTTIRNVRLWDPQPLLDTLNQIQSIRLYYDFVDVDVDRYHFEGDYRQVMLSARELSPEKLAGQAQTWVNRRLQFTHGYGLAMVPVNEVTSGGLPELFVQDVPPQGRLKIDRPEIYFGEKGEDFVIVRTNTAEFDYPRGDDNVYGQYAGQHGVNIGSLGRRLLFAFHFGDVNILLSNSLSTESKLLYYRNVLERMRRIAPFLMYDPDPYLVVADGRLYWMADAYTYSDRYPYSLPHDGEFNYLRNSAKVVVDAYEGTASFYMADTSDPLINTYASIFPGLFRPLSDMPVSLREHVRYPEQQFKVQAELYRTYHMQDPQVFYNKEDLWSVPNEIYLDKPVPMEPYYVIMRLPGESQEEFVLIRPYTPPNKDNMITWLAARSDGANYGQLVAYKFPKEKLIFGPMQIESRINQDPVISQQLTLWNQQGSRVIRGNLMVIPIGRSSLYVEPIYLQSEQSRLPEMTRVIVANGNSIVMEPTVAGGLARLFGGTAQQPTAGTPPVQPGTAAPPAASQAAQDLLRSLQDRQKRLQDELTALQSDLQRLQQLLGGTPSTSPTPAPGSNPVPRPTPGR